VIRLVVPNGQDTRNLLACMADMLPGIRTGEAKKILQNGDVKRNGVRTRKDETIYAGDVLEVYLPKNAQPYPIPELVYRDENIIVVNKNPGVSVVEDREDGKPTLQQLLAFAVEEKGIKPIACHRLDHNTGGLVLFATNEKVNESVCEAIAQRKISKYYRTIVVGVPSKTEAELTGYLKKDASAAYVRIENKPTKGALTVKTRYTMIRTNSILSLLEVELITGRTHQIRAHLASVGLPVLGDDKYGDRAANKKYGAKYQALWATKLVFYTNEGPLGYLDGKVIETDRVCFPDVDL
jgi:RluA family pseudouridine synthase